ncbi:hypothetical protein Cantr_08243 [Candida viswanathii]|uniref:Uncharacterized protein n=1 Tax=Candida viswanathii TaxID=5486 RepID=A0A367Y616_9ASCO|nr:hypothetical protein Cantr_08243 [Candida viswanathii]
MAPTALVDRRTRRKAKKNSSPVPIPNPTNITKMSETIETSSGAETPEVEVQVVNEQEFENDLDYLLTNKEKVEGEVVYSEAVTSGAEIVILDSFAGKSAKKKEKGKEKGGPKKGPKRFTVADVTKDMEGIDFSSDDDDDDEEEVPKKNDVPELKKKKSSGRLNKKRSERGLNRVKSEAKKDNLRKSRSNENLRPKIDTKDIKKDQAEVFNKDVLDNSEEQGKSETTKKAKKSKNRKKGKDAAKTTDKDNTPEEADTIDSTPDADVTQDFDEGDTTIATIDGEEGETEEDILKRKLKNKKRKDRRKKRAALNKEGAAENEEPDNTPKSKETTPEAAPEADTSNPFSIKLRSVKSTTNKKYSENLPEVQPIKTIIGMSHQQILHSDLSDVKIKTLMTSSSISKYAANSVKFVTSHTNDLFADFDKKKIFLTLCINVALYESLGFKKTVKTYPNVLELFGDYDEINLETTRTKLTPSKKDIHQNNLDYSVLSYFGHILIWAAHQQRLGKVPIFTDKFDIVLTNKEVRSKLGGYHLWDKLFRELKGMNSKRWKHVIKFRNTFLYEEDQFMIILRFMQIDDNIP